ncbi:transglycosylase SLT domain-containing protein [Nocardia acididurans]|nr:transglycosylase SLT domain-containing protein [Nocardia acididurans]
MATTAISPVANVRSARGPANGIPVPGQELRAPSPPSSRHGQAAATHAGDTTVLALGMPALYTLATLAQRFGTHIPAPVDSSSHVPETRAPREFAGSAVVAAYADRATALSADTRALATFDSELARILGRTATDTLGGRAAVQSILAEVNTAITALGAQTDTPAVRAMLATIVNAALARADNVLDRGRSQSSTNADQVARLTQQYFERRSSSPAATYSGQKAPLNQPTGTQRQWIDEALRVLAQHGYDTRRIDPTAIATIIEHESSGNPHAINLWDSNAAAGTPSKGLMQTIDSTFAVHSLPGHRDIWNPVDNIIAGVRYSIDRYGSLENVPGIRAMNSGGGYIGY